MHEICAQQKYTSPIGPGELDTTPLPDSNSEGVEKEKKQRLNNPHDKVIRIKREDEVEIRREKLLMKEEGR